MVKFKEAEARKFRNVFVCKKCKQKLRTSNLKVIAEKVTCKKCGSHAFRTVRKK
jgi:Zn finger protein HypA/HybF involved in hydrogenase expression